MLDDAEPVVRLAAALALLDVDLLENGPGVAEQCREDAMRTLTDLQAEENKEVASKAARFLRCNSHEDDL